MIKLIKEGPKKKKLPSLKKKKHEQLPSLHCGTSLDSMKIMLKAAQEIPCSVMDLSVLASQTDRKGQTAVHALSQHLKSIDALEYLINELDCETIQNVLTKTDAAGRTALHTSTCSDITRLLIENVSMKQRKEFILAQDLQGNTAALCTRHTDVMWTLQETLKEFPDGEQKKLICIRNSEGNTPLHCVRTPEVAQAIIDTLWDLGEHIDPYVFEKNSRQQTIFHTASIAGRREVIAYLKRVLSYKTVSRITQMVDEEGNTTLHYARYGRMANVLIHGVMKREQTDFLLHKNRHGHTALDKAVTEGMVSALVRAVPLEHRLAYISQCISSREKSAIPHTARSRRFEEHLDELLQKTRTSLAKKEAGTDIDTDDENRIQR